MLMGSNAKYRQTKTSTVFPSQVSSVIMKKFTKQADDSFKVSYYRGEKSNEQVKGDEIRREITF